MASDGRGHGVKSQTGRRESSGGSRKVRPVRRTAVVRMALAVTLSAALLCSAFGQSAGAETAREKRLGYSLAPSTTKPYTPCPPGGRMIECNIVIDPAPVKTPSGYRQAGGGPLFEGGGELGGYDPKDLQSAYGIPTTGGTTETVAIVDAYGYAAAESDLAKYREKYGLAACTKASGCFKKVNQKGEEKNYPPEGGELEVGWTVETALDLDMVSAACPGCHILLVQATTQEAKDTAASVEEAATLKATEISNSYGYPENNETFCPAKKGCKEYLAAYNHAGIPVTVSTGDSGYDDGVGAPSWPATSPNVIAVGGTSLNKATGSRGWSEKAWAGGGSGCSLYESKPAWQIDPSCSKRIDSDVSAVADPNTPVSVYNTPAASGWVNIGGTSVSSPLLAGIEAHANSATKTASAEAFYKHPGMLFDVTVGSNGICTPPAENAYACKAGPGYDGPTGEGTPNGVPHLSGWFTRGIPNLAKFNAKNISLSSTSCNSIQCMAVGGYVNAAGTRVPLAESWDGVVGDEWGLQELPNLPAGAKSGSLSGVSCESILFIGLNECTAVGSYINSSGVETPLAEQNFNNGFGWALATLPSPKEAKGAGLTGISCATGESCYAVGHYINSAGTELTLAEHWTLSGGWSILETANPTGAKSASLSGVSCLPIEPSEGCVAVGHYVNSAGTEVMLEELLFIGKWMIGEMANPTGAKSSRLLGVRCPISSTCAAVGNYVNSGSKEVTLAEQITTAGNKGAVQETPNAKEAKSNSLASVSCTETKACTAVGHDVNSAGTEVTLAERWNGTAWSIQETPNPTGAKSSSLAGVWCPGTEECVGVGRYVKSTGTELTLAELWNGTAWSIQGSPNPTVASGSLPSLSCPAAEACTAVGHYINEAGTEVTLAEGWNGKEWTLQETVTPTGAKSSSLSGVSCTSAEACTAVGHYVNSSGVEVTLAEVFASKKWAIQETVTPTGAKSSSLSGVSCTAAEACTAVGRYVNSSNVEVTLAEVFASKKWAIQETVTPTGAKSSSLSGVSCTAAEACTAVGRYVNSSNVEVTLAEVFASKKWAIQETVTPTGAKSSSLSGVSCTAAEACTGVGRYVNSSNVEVTLAEVFASKKWAIQETVTPTGAKSSSLSGVSCTAAEACTGVGRYVNSSNVEVTLAEVFASKKWAIQETPNPEAKSSSLSGVSCHTAETCIAAGNYNTGGEVALVEEHA